MVQIWLTEPFPCGDPRLPHHIFPPKLITPDELTKRTGTLYWKLDTLDQIALSKRLTIMKMERNFKREDIFTLDAANISNFDDKVALLIRRVHFDMQIEELFEEAATLEDQAKMIIEGSAYFDVEDKNGQWVRILCEYGDLILIPANVNHRFTTTPKNFVKIRRFFKSEEAC